MTLYDIEVTGEKQGLDMQRLFTQAMAEEKKARCSPSVKIRPSHQNPEEPFFMLHILTIHQTAYRLAGVLKRFFTEMKMRYYLFGIDPEYSATAQRENFTLIEYIYFAGCPTDICLSKKYPIFHIENIKFT